MGCTCLWAKAFLSLPGSGEKVSLRGLVSGEYSSMPNEERGDLRPFSPTADKAEVTFLLLKIIGVKIFRRFLNFKFEDILSNKNFK